jgi:hypothetical protein
VVADSEKAADLMRDELPKFLNLHNLPPLKLIEKFPGNIVHIDLVCAHSHKHACTHAHMHTCTATATPTPTLSLTHTISHPQVKGTKMDKLRVLMEFEMLRRAHIIFGNRSGYSMWAHATREREDSIMVDATVCQITTSLSFYKRKHEKKIKNQ